MLLPVPLLRRHFGDAARLSLGVALVVVLMTCVADGAGRCSDEGCPWVRPQDTVAVISSRPVGCSTSPERLEAGLHAEQYVAEGDGTRRVWRQTHWRSVVEESDPGTPTIVFAHGNKIAWSETRRRGLYIYKRLLRCAGDERPIRFVIWSWCADEMRRPLNDYRAKAARTRPVGKQLGWVVNQFASDVPLGFIGYSYGSRVISGALHELGSGSLNGPDRWVRAVYIASAFDSHWLSRRSAHGSAMDVTEQLLVTTNRKDPAMRFYRFLVKNYNPQALGYSGPTCLNRERASRVRLMNVARCVGASHNLCDYVNSPGLMSKAWRMLTYSDRAPQSDEVLAADGS